MKAVTPRTPPAFSPGVGNISPLAWKPSHEPSQAFRSHLCFRSNLYQGWMHAGCAPAPQRAILSQRPGAGGPGRVLRGVRAPRLGWKGRSEPARASPALTAIPTKAPWGPGRAPGSGRGAGRAGGGGTWRRGAARGRHCAGGAAARGLGVPAGAAGPQGARPRTPAPLRPARPLPSRIGSGAAQTR